MPRRTLCGVGKQPSGFGTVFHRGELDSGPAGRGFGGSHHDAARRSVRVPDTHTHTTATEYAPPAPPARRRRPQQKSCAQRAAHVQRNRCVNAQATVKMSLSLNTTQVGDGRRKQQQRHHARSLPKRRRSSTSEKLRTARCSQAQRMQHSERLRREREGWTTRSKRVVRWLDVLNSCCLTVCIPER